MSARANPRGLGPADRLARMEEALSLHRPGTQRPHQQRRRSPAVQRLTALAICLSLVALLPSLGLYVATRADSAQRIIARAIPATTELDGLLSLHGADLQAHAKADTHTPVVLPEFPINVSLPAVQVAQASPQRMSLLFATRAAAAIYERGFGAFALADARPANRTGPLLSSQWAMHQALGLLNTRSHARFKQTTLGLGLITAILLLLFSFQVRGYGRLVGFGVTGLVAAVAAALVTLFGWLIVEVNYNGASSALGSAAWGMIADVAWTMALIDLVAAGCCLALAAAGYLFARLDSPDHSRVTGASDRYNEPVVEISGRGTRALDRLPKPPPPTN